MARSSEQICFDDIIHKQANQRSSCVTFVSKLPFSFFLLLQWAWMGAGVGRAGNKFIQLRKAAQESI